MKTTIFSILALFSLYVVLCVAQIIPIGGVGRGAGATGPWTFTSVSQPSVINSGCSPTCPAVAVTTPAALGNLVVLFAYAYNVNSVTRLSAVSGLGAWSFPTNCNAFTTGGLAGDVSCAWAIVNNVTGCTATCQVTATLSANTSNQVQLVLREYHLAAGTIGIENLPAGITSTSCGNNTSLCTTPTATITGSSDLVIGAIAVEGTACSAAAPFANFVNPFGEGSADRVNAIVGTGAGFTQQIGPTTCLLSNSNNNAAMITAAFTNQGSTSISLLKTGPTSFQSIGQVLTYTFAIQNTGNTTLNGTFNITDAKVGNIAGCGGTNIFLPPGVTATCMANYTVTANDFNNPPITNTAQASLGALLSNPSTVMVPLNTGNSIDITDTMHPTMYGGAKCDGTTDDTNNIQRTLNYASNNNIPTVTAPANVTCRMRTYLGCPRPGDTDNHCGPTGCGFGSNSCGCVNYGTCNIQFPAGVTFKGGAGTILDGDGMPVINEGLHLTTWRNDGPFYKVNNTVFGNTFITLTNAADAANFAVGNYIDVFYWRPADNQCAVHQGSNPCDVLPMQVEQLTGVNGSTGQLSFVDKVARNWNNGDGTGPGSANCTAAIGPTCSNTGVCSNCLSALECNANGGNCTINYPSLPTEIVVTNITNQTYHDCFVDTMTIRGPMPFNVNEVYNCGLINVTAFENGSCFQGRTDINSIEHSVFTNVTWTVQSPGQICNFTSFDFFQRASGNNVYTNFTFGDAAGNWWGAYGEAEFGYNDTMQNGTFYLNQSNVGCGSEWAGANQVVKNNTFQQLMNNGLCNISAGFTASFTDNSSAPPLIATQDNWVRNVFDSNTINAYGNATYSGFNSLNADTQITNNHFFNLAGSNAAAMLVGLFGFPNAATWSTNDFHFNNGAGTGTGILLQRNGIFNGMHIDGNSFFGAGGTAINVSANPGSSNCSIMGNSMHANMSVNVTANGCTITGN